MKEVNEKYYLSTDGKRFNSEEECLEYEESYEKEESILKQIHELNHELASLQYLRIKETCIKGTEYDDGYYQKCPHCGKKTGGYEFKNCELKVDDGIYKCTGCGNFFIYR